MHEAGKVAGCIKFVTQPRAFKALCESREILRCIFTTREGIHKSLGGNHATLHGGVITFDLHAV